MNKKNNQMQLFFFDAVTPEIRSAVACLKSWGYDVLHADNDLAGFDLYKDNRPPIALVNMDLPDAAALVEKICATDPDAQILVISAEEIPEGAINGFKHRVAGFIRAPLKPFELEIALKRVSEFIELRRRLYLMQEQLEAPAGDKADEMIETERFLAVRQIVDKMSSFIAQVAGDVHGGVKYFHELPYFVSIHSCDCKVLAVNTTYRKYLGNRINGDSCAIYSGKRASKESCPVGRTIRTEATLETRALVRYASGAQVPVIVHTTPIFNDDGEVEMVLEIFAGSKEIEHLAEDVRSTQQRYQQLFNAMPSYVAVLDRRLRINAINRRFKEDFGDPIGSGFFDILRPGSFPAFRDPITASVKDGMPHKGELVLTDQNHIQHNMMAWTAPIKTMAGKLIQVLVIFTDITEVRQLEDNLSALGLMIGSISHDLKGCLTGLDAGLYLVDTGFYRDRPGRIEEGLDVARLMVERIRKLVQDILYYTKERELEIQEMDVEQFAIGVAATVDNRIRGANIQFNCVIEADSAKIEIDPGLIRSALVNILENAMEACIDDPGEKAYHIDFHVRRVDKEIQFDITDNGSGMDEKQKKKIFTIFYSTKGSKGTGLGLFIANKAIQKHGGHISVDSEPGKGTAFHIRLPLKISRETK
jgi:signal transduction histidine kinase/DNA-binding NarL/FixJ family response regulator